MSRVNFYSVMGGPIARLWHLLKVQWVVLSWAAMSCYALADSEIDSVNFKITLTAILALAAWTGYRTQRAEVENLKERDLQRELLRDQEFKLRKIQDSISEERERAGLILRILENRSAFRVLLNDYEIFFRRAREVLDTDIGTLREDLHTLKGAAMLLAAESLAQKAFETERTIKTSPPPDSALVKMKIRELEDFFASWRQKDMPLFTQLGVFDADMLEVSKRKIREIEMEFSQSPEQLRYYHQITDRLLETEFADLLRDFEFHIKTVSQKLEKKIRFEVVQPQILLLVEPGTYRETLRPFIHIFNNALDHGIETPKERVLAGKAAEGRITVRYEVCEDDGFPVVRMEIEDDGRGIDVDRLRKNLRAKGLKNVDSMSDLEVVGQIFRGNLSTRDSVTEFSGQGVGMAAIGVAIRKVHGRIAVLRTGKNGTTFEIVIPQVIPPASLYYGREVA